MLQELRRVEGWYQWCALVAEDLVIVLDKSWLILLTLEI